jgi:hypothetical protein
MAYQVHQWPPKTVYPGEAMQFPEAKVMIDVLIQVRFRQDGPRPLGYSFKPLGKQLDGLWQINLKVKRRQIRILYAPYDQTITVFHIHKKASRQDQQNGYAVARRRKQQYEAWIKGQRNDRPQSLH